MLIGKRTFLRIVWCGSAKALVGKGRLLRMVWSGLTIASLVEEEVLVNLIAKWKKRGQTTAIAYHSSRRELKSFLISFFCRAR